MKYTLKDFNADFPTDRACLDYLFKQRFPNGGKCVCGKTNCFYQSRKRKCYSCSWCGHQISPTADTIFHKSKTSLKSWFFAMFLLTSSSKNRVPAMELKRQLGVTYKTAWRMAHQIRKLMQTKDGPLKGFLEMDKVFIGGHRKGVQGRSAARKTCVIPLPEPATTIRPRIVSITTETECDENYEMSGEDFDKLNQKRRAIGKVAQEIVLKSEHRRLCEGGRADLAEEIKDVSGQPAFGYDICSYELNGDQRHIEVKAARRTGRHVSFYLSANERRKSQKLKNYYFYLVFGCQQQNPDVVYLKARQVPPTSLTPATYSVNLSIN